MPKLDLEKLELQARSEMQIDIAHSFQFERHFIAASMLLLGPILCESKLISHSWCSSPLLLGV